MASASPRRSDLLRWAGVSFEVNPASIEENRKPGESPIVYATRLATEKALVRGSTPRLALGADTTVFIGDRVFDKPDSPKEAASHLADLNGQTHQVVTAFCLAAGGRALKSEAVVSRVTFRSLSQREIDSYIADGEGLDKAGAYGLQGMGGFLVESIEGSYTNIIGLPLKEVLAALAEMGA